MNDHLPSVPYSCSEVLNVLACFGIVHQGFQPPGEHSVDEMIARIHK
jgi:hypothetical protein